MTEATESSPSLEPSSKDGERSLVEPSASNSRTCDRTGAIIRSCWTTIGLGLFGFLVVYPVVELIIDWYTPPSQGTEVEDMTLGELIQLRAVQVFAAAWAFTFGACVGSFVNVLVYRQPRGESVLTRPSACPSCGKRIELRDNVPVLGWLLLGGRCRACQSPISPRYPIVEAVVGATFAFLLFVELTSGGANLPVRRPNTYAGFVWTIFYPKWDLIALTIYHFHLFVMLLTWGLMSLDGVRVPVRSILPAFLVAGGLPLLWTKLAVVPPGFVGTMYYPQDLAVTAASLAAGGVAGVALAIVAALYRLGSSNAVVPSIALIGIALGWQAVTVIGVTSISIAGLAKLIAGRRVNFAFVLLVVAIGHHAVWRPIFGALFSP